jgi:outer membrane protein assembly factor BamD
MKHIKIISLLLLIGVALSSCSDYQKLLKSTDYNVKYERAKKYYEEEQYVKAATLLEDVVPLFKGSGLAEESLHLQAMTSFRQKDYMFAEHYFDQLVRTYPRSEYLKESYFNRAYCFYMQSPSPKLDQASTKKAIEAFELFMNLFPESSEAKESAKYIDDLHDKLAYKAYLNAKIYFDLGTYQGNNYEAAIITARNCLKDYPSNKHHEELSFLILESYFIVAQNSIMEKREERYRAVVDEYYSFLNDFPESIMKKDADVFFKKAQKILNLK